MLGVPGGIARIALIAGLVWVAGAAGARAQEPTDSAATFRQVLDRYCAGCHNERLLSGNLALDRGSIDITRIGAGGDVWEKVLQKLQTQAMPPPGRPRPDAETYHAFAAWLESSLDGVAAADPNPGRPTIHRLNRLEYANAIRDLLGLEVDAEMLLPADDLAFGFDNNADILTVAPGLLERYLSAARKLSRLAVGDLAIGSDAVRYPVSTLLEQGERMGDDLPFGSRGGAAIRHHFPLDGEYVIRLALRDGRRAPQVDVRIDGARVALLSVDPDADAETSEDPLSVRVPVPAGSHVVSVTFPEETFTPEGVAPSRLPIWTFSTGRGYVQEVGLDSLLIEGPFNPDRVGPGDGGLGDSAARSRIFVCTPATEADEAPCANEILATLARRAFRRPVTEQDVAVIEGFYRDGRAGGNFDTGIQRALEALLVDPEFLFRIESDPEGVAPGAPYPLSDIELASRLSFFLWSTIPDDELLALAEAGRLSEPEELERQVRRMLADQRASVLVDSFAAQWLHLRRMRSVTPDVLAFPEFEDNLRQSFVRETELLIEHQMRQDRSVVDLLTADYTFVNERLARHYGIPNVYGSRFRRLTLPDDTRRGLLGHGSILTVTSLATRTSPVVRGKWVLENILGTPPPPPPPDVPELEEREDDGAVRSLRQRLEEHRANPVCANCHARMDPIGFALEGFDAVGRHRVVDANGTPIDTSGTLPDGRAFDGLPALRDVLFERRTEFVATVTEKLLTYALGRGIEYYDRPAIRAIVREAGEDDYRWSSLILGVVKSVPFQMRRAES